MPGSDIHASDQNTVLFQSTEWGQFEPLIAPLSARQASAVDEYTSPHDICNKCIVFRTFLQELNVSELQPDWKHEISHHATGISLESSARAGCHLCSLLWDSLADLNHSSGLTDSYEFRGLMIGRGGTQITLTIRKEKEDELQYLGIGESIDPSKDRLEVSAKLLWRGQHCFFAKPLRVYSLTGTRAQELAERKTSLSSKCTASSASFLLASRWIEECLREHSACSRPKISAADLPTRLIDVGPINGTQDPRLLETSKHDLPLEYLCLSHCWGGAETFKLTSDTHSVLELGVSMECLPRTFQDAIIITRRLGYRLLWIDSLCILQDDEDDWKHEAASMGRVYGNSICTIAALGAVNSYEGCFAQRDPLRYHPCRLFATDESGPYAFPSSGLDALHKSFKLAPLNKQGWTFQERLLSPRTLNYGAIVTWECGEHFASESCPQGHLDFGLTAKRRFHHSLSLMNSSQSFELSRFFTDWAEIVYEYSQAEFTFDRDRYYALSGITSAIATSTGLRYICGLWSNFLRQGLLWFIIPSYNDCRGKIWRLTRYEMPSWSWSSVLAPARYPNVVTRMEASDSSYQWLAEVIETGPQPASSPQQSPIPVQYQYIKMSAGLKDVVIKPLGIKGSQIDSMENERCNNSDYRLHQLWLDTQEQYRGSGILLPLLLKHNNNVSDHHKIHGLLLLPTSDHPYEYKRIGYFELVDVPDFSSYVKQDRVTIILV